MADTGMARVIPREWAKPIEGELWEVLESLDEAQLAIAACLREHDPPDEMKRFSEQFLNRRDELQKLLLDALSPETVNLDADD